MKKLHTLLILTAVLAGSAYAGLPTTAPEATGAPSQGSAAASAADMVDGEIRKVDVGNRKITIKHGEIKNLDMPGMTMVFQARDPALLGKVKAGDKVRFQAEKDGTAFVVTVIQLVK